MKRLREATCVVYGMGSLYTSLCPSLILKGVGETIASKSAQDARKVSNDKERERGTHSEPPSPPKPHRQASVKHWLLALQLHCVSMPHDADINPTL